MLIELHDIVLQHEDHSILKGVNFCVDDNDFIYIIGKVGSGKTSLLRILYGELSAEAGEGNVLEFDINKLKTHQLPQLRKQLGIIFQDFQLLREMTVEQNLDFVLKATGWKKKNRPAIRNRSAEYGKNRKTSADPRPLRTWRCYQCP